MDMFTKLSKYSSYVLADLIKGGLPLHLFSITPDEAEHAMQQAHLILTERGDA